MKFVVIRGLSGSGKTKRAKDLLDAHPNESKAMFSSDDFFIDKKVVTMKPSGGVMPDYHFDVTKLSMAHASCRKQIMEAFAKRVELVVLHNTCVRVWEYDDITVAAQTSGYDVEILEIACPTRSVLMHYWRRNQRGVALDLVGKWWLLWEEDKRAKILELEPEVFRLVTQEIGQLAGHVPDVISEFRHRIQGAVGELWKRISS